MLAQIDPRPFAIALHQAQAALAPRRGAGAATRKLQPASATRTSCGQKLIPQQQVDDQQTTVDQAKAAIAAIKRRSRARGFSSTTPRIKSPIDGVTGVRLVDPGNIVHAARRGRHRRRHPARSDGRHLHAARRTICREYRKELATGPLTVEAYSRDGGDAARNGQAPLIDNQVNQATATIRLKAIFPNPDRRALAERVRQDRGCCSRRRRARSSFRPRRSSAARRARSCTSSTPRTRRPCAPSRSSSPKTSWRSSRSGLVGGGPGRRRRAESAPPRAQGRAARRHARRRARPRQATAVLARRRPRAPEAAGRRSP